MLLRSLYHLGGDEFGKCRRVPARIVDLRGSLGQERRSSREADRFRHARISIGWIPYIELYFRHYVFRKCRRKPGNMGKSGDCVCRVRSRRASHACQAGVQFGHKKPRLLFFVAAAGRTVPIAEYVHISSLKREEQHMQLCVQYGLCVRM